MNRTPPRDPAKVGSFAELKWFYKLLIEQLDECHRQRRAIEGVNKTTRHDLHDARVDAKVSHRKVIALTMREHAKAKEKSSAAYAGTAATILIISYQVVEVAGGWGQWSPVFEHEATYGVLQVMIGSILAFAMRPLH